MNPVKVGLLGLGTVGGGTVNVLTRNAEEIARRAGRGIEIVHASARDLSKPRICDTSGIKLTTHPAEVVNDADVEVVVELIGGDGLALELVMQAIDNGKHVVTANKALIAKHGNDIFTKAQEKGVTVAFEAAVAGGIPIIKAIREGLAANRIEWLAGIINGTGNFILTEMRDKGRDFDDVLKEAQELGYAEADPTFDVEGIDAAHKLTILASIAFGIPLQFDKAFTEGITRITREDVEYAEQLGYRIKHLGVSRMTDSGVELRVHPTLIPERRLIANVDGVMNAVLVQGDAVGPTLYYGAGAGDEPTASAVVADLVDVVRALTSDPENRVPHLAFQPDAIANTPILPVEEIETAYYLRMQAEDRPGVLADVTRILGDQGISIEAIIQQEPNGDDDAKATIILLTHSVKA
ncbi:MAG: homoserine dehydrogenase, partial [Gammaproteobacteria bacterium]|nr:homoserine dehydrogenase [Gammaproteobacteria bacterium]